MAQIDEVLAVRFLSGDDCPGLLATHVAVKQLYAVGKSKFLHLWDGAQNHMKGGYCA